MWDGAVSTPRKARWGLRSLRGDLQTPGARGGGRALLRRREGAGCEGSQPTGKQLRQTFLPRGENAPARVCAQMGECCGLRAELVCRQVCFSLKTAKMVSIYPGDLVKRACISKLENKNRVRAGPHLLASKQSLPP